MAEDSSVMDQSSSVVDEEQEAEDQMRLAPKDTIIEDSDVDLTQGGVNISKPPPSPQSKASKVASPKNISPKSVTRSESVQRTDAPKSFTSHVQFQLQKAASFEYEEPDELGQSVDE